MLLCLHRPPDATGPVGGSYQGSTRAENLVGYLMRTAQRGGATALNRTWIQPRWREGALSRLAIARLQSAGVPVMPLLKRVGLPPESASAQKAPTTIRIGASSSSRAARS